jgi:hypothetical protein
MQAYMTMVVKLLDEEPQITIPLYKHINQIMWHQDTAVRTSTSRTCATSSIAQLPPECNLSTLVYQLLFFPFQGFSSGFKM